MTWRRVIRYSVAGSFFLSLGLSAQGSGGATSAPELSSLVFGSTAVDLLARTGFLIIYGSSVLSRGVHRAYPVIDPEQHRLIAFLSGCLDALSVNGQGVRGSVSCPSGPQR